jgi:hypothetical protein
MISTYQEEEAIAAAKQLDPDVRVSPGINWNWVYGFKTRELAEQFDDYCLESGLETRGIYYGGSGTYDVRFRF